MSFVETHPEKLCKLNVERISPLTLLDIFPTIKCGITTNRMLHYINGSLWIDIPKQQLSNANLDADNIYEFLKQLILSPRLSYAKKFEHFHYIKNVALIHPKIDPLLLCNVTLDKDIIKYINDTRYGRISTYISCTSGIAPEYFTDNILSFDNEGIDEKRYCEIQNRLSAHTAILIKDKMVLIIMLLKEILPKDIAVQIALLF